MDADTLVKFGEFTQFQSASYTKRLNASGSATITFALDDRISTLVQPLQSALYFERNGVMVWSGPITSREDQLPGRTVTVQAVGYFERLMKRVFRDFQTSYVKIDSGVIASNLLDIANAQLDTGIRIVDLDANMVQRDRTYRRFEGIGEKIIELSTVESGFDFQVVNRDMYIKKELGTYRGLNATAAPCTFGYQTAFRNIATVSRSVDTANMATRFDALCSASIETVEDTAGVSTYGLFEVSQDLGQVNSSIARAFAAAEVAVRGIPYETWDVSLIAVDDDEIVPRFDGDSTNDTHYFGLGDTVRVLVEDPKLPALDVGLRVFGATLTLDAQGTERTTSIQLAGPIRTFFNVLGFPDPGSYYTADLAGNPTTSTVYTDGAVNYESIPVGGRSLGRLPWMIGASALGVETILS